MKKIIIILAAVVCSVAAMAQSQADEALKEMEKKVKVADGKQTDGRAQLDAALACINDELGDKKDLQRGLVYAERALKIAEAQTVLKDTLLGHTHYTLGVIYIQQNDYGKACEYFEKAMNAFERELGADDPVTNGTKMVYSYMIMQMQPFRGFPYIQEAFYNNSIAPEDKRITNMDEANILLETSLEMLIAAYTEYFKTAVPLIVRDGSQYLLVQSGDWNIEKPLVGWLVPTLMRSEEENADFVGDEIIFCDGDFNFTAIPAEEKEKGALTFNFRHFLNNPRTLVSNPGDSRILFLNTETYEQLRSKYREFKASRK